MTPCGSLRRNKTVQVVQGWMVSLEDQIKKMPEINLSVCYPSNQSEDDFIYEGVQYYPLSRDFSQNKVSQIFYRLQSDVEKERQLLPLLLNVVEKANPDIIHIHGTEECFGLIQDYIKNIPIVFSIQGLIAPYTEKYYSGYPESFISRNESFSNKLKGSSNKMNYRSYQYRGLRELRFLERAKYIIGRTSFDHYLPLLCNPDVQIFQGEEILRKEFYTTQWNKQKFGDKLILVSIISPGVYKGFETLLHSAKLLKRFAHFDFEWKVIGYHSNHKYVKLAEKLKECRSTDVNIDFLGRMQASDMIGVLTNADLYVQVSHIENSPNSLCEAMLIGMPIIASFAGGTSSMLKDGEEGILVQDGDPFTLAGAIAHLRNNFEMAINFARNGRIRAKFRHNPLNIASQLKNTYFEIINNNS